MTFTDVVNLVAGDLNLTSTTAITRIGTHVNRRYRRVTSSIGMNVFRRTEVSLALTLGSRDQTVTGIERITAIFNDTDPTAPFPLEEFTYDEIRELMPQTAGPLRWAPKLAGSNQVTFRLDSNVTSPLTLTIEGEATASDLSGLQVPAFNESYHDILVFGAKSDEFRKMDKIAQARDMESDYERVLGELRLHISVGAYLDIIQAKKIHPPVNSRLWRRWNG